MEPSQTHGRRTRPPPIPAPLAAAVCRIAVAQICRSAGYRAAEPAALQALADDAARYLFALARVAASAANARGRTDANLLDVALALEDLGLPRGFPGAADPTRRLLGPSAGPLRGLVEFVASVDEIPFASPIRRREALPGAPPPRTSPSFAQLRLESPFQHVPRWLPGFPDTWDGGHGDGHRKKGRKEGTMEGGDATEKPWEQKTGPPSDGTLMVEKERERKSLPAERARVRFRLRSGARGRDEGGEKKRKMELTSAMGMPFGKRTHFEEGLSARHRTCDATRSVS